jgi:hypothetical protein
MIEAHRKRIFALTAESSESAQLESDREIGNPLLWDLTEFFRINPADPAK